MAAVRAVFHDPAAHSAYLQMPYYAGGDLGRWLAATPPQDRSVSTCLHVLRDVASALHHLHGRGHVHCNVKPSNIFLTGGGRAVLGNFDGLHKSGGGDGCSSMGLSTLSLVAATAEYVAPEVAAAWRRTGGVTGGVDDAAFAAAAAFTAAADIYSLGKVTRQMLSGALLTAEETADAGTLISSMLFDEPVKRLSALDIYNSIIVQSEDG